MTPALPLRPRPPGSLRGPLVHLDAVDSTNDRARALALAGAPDGTVVLAEEQTAGRGRQGRSWSAPRGRALTLSVVMRWESPALAETLELLPLAVAVAVCEACEHVAPVTCRIKWPNDVWIGERKLAGILIESRPQAGWTVIGIGLNVDTPPEELGPELSETATSLRIETGQRADRDKALGALLDRLARRLEDVREGGSEFLAAYRERDLLSGRQVGWTANGRGLQGKAQGIDHRGRLVVFHDSGERLVLEAGEVHMAPASPDPE